MRKAILVLVVAAACGGSPAPAPAQPQPISNAQPTSAPPAAAPAAAVDPHSVEGALAKMDSFKDSMCACADQACAQHVADDMTKWGQDMAEHDQAQPMAKPTDDQMKKMADITQQMTQCMTKAMGAGGSGSGNGP